MFESVLHVDRALFRAVAAVHSPAADVLMVLATEIGRTGAVFLVLGLLAVAVRRSRAPGFAQLALAIGLAGLVNDHLVKPLAARDRPFVGQADVRVLGVRPDTHSFTSGHAALAAAGAAGLSAMWPAARTFAWILAALVAVSRVYVGVHYPSDVIVGFLIGLMVARFAVGGTVWDRRWPIRAASPPPGR
jgi:undecaprenyl-diphosphatase